MRDHQVSCCPDGRCDAHGPRSGVSRRGFLGMSTAAASAAILAAHTRDALAAGELPDRSLVPADKGLSAETVAALRERGTPTRYTGADLRYIGMPVGGGCSGQVYVGGDGRLWYWDVDNGPPAPGADGGGEVYVSPREPSSPFGHGVVLKTTARGRTTVRGVDGTGFDQIGFTGQYPLGRVDYQGHDVPVRVHLDAFSPFVPGDAEDSTLPVTVLAYTVTNTSPDPVRAELTVWAENPVCLRSRSEQPITLSSARTSGDGTHGVRFEAAEAGVPSPRPDIVFETWERAAYDGWTVEGEAFGPGPVLLSQVPDYMKRFGDLHVRGERFVTSHNFTAAGGDAGKADGYTGKLTSAPFTVERRYVMAWVGGGADAAHTGLRVVVDGAVVGSVGGDNTEPLGLRGIDLIRYQGRTAHIEIVDSATGAWGHLNVDEITFTDLPASRPPFDALADGGTVAITAFTPDAVARPSLADWSTPAAVADSGPGPGKIDGGLGTIAGAVTVPLALGPGQSRTVRFAYAWYFPVPDRSALSFLTGSANLRRHYAARFDSADGVARHLAAELDRLEAATREWVKTWYDDSTLPHWFLERTLTTASTLATSTCLRFTDGRFYAWEGVGCCAGTCEHVWNYAQALGRLFPELERLTREHVDLGVGFHPGTGEIGNRAEADMGWATDGQCGTILRIYREHQMTSDLAFLRRVWPRVKQALGWVIAHDTRQDGTLEGAQPNTLDAVWYGEIAWMTGMYDAALYAGAHMAEEVGDRAFAKRCRTLADAGARSLATDLWTGEYFIQIVDQHHPETVNSNIGCHIDQMFGQSLAGQLGLPRVFPEDKAKIALGNIYRYNFVPDPAAYRAANTAIPGGRWYATAHEPAVVMTTFPHGGASQANGSPPVGVASYFNESWTGQEYQLAAHMVGEGLVDEGLVVTRAVHDRYGAAKRNPYNEIECSDHYARAMAGFGVYLAACGYSHHGPAGRLGFAPKLTPENFAAAFTAAGGWGLYRQRRDPHSQSCEVEVRHGRVTVRTLALEIPAAPPGTELHVTARRDGRPVKVASVTVDGTAVEVEFAGPVAIGKGSRLSVTVPLPS
jgi:non-lysosomal glucosylceramidase